MVISDNHAGGDLIINIIVPSEEIKIELSEINKFLLKEKLIEGAKYQDLQNQINNLENYISSIENEQVAFSKQIQELQEEFKTLKSIIDNSVISFNREEVKNKIIKTEMLISSAEKLSNSNELIVKEIKGKKYYGFNREDLLKKGVYKIIGDFSNGLAKVYRSNRCGYINQLGKLVIPLKFEDCKDFSEGLAPVKFNGNWRFINKTGEFQFDQSFENVYGFYHNSAPVQLDYNTWILINKRGEKISNEYRTISAFDSYGMAIMEYEHSKYGLISSNGKVYLKKYKSHRLTPIGYGLYKFADGNFSHYGIVSHSGKIILPPNYSTITDFGIYKTAVVQKYTNRDGIITLINTEGKQLAQSPKSDHYCEGDWRITDDLLIMSGSVNLDIFDIRNGNIIAKNVHNCTDMDKYEYTISYQSENNEGYLTCINYYNDTIAQIWIEDYNNSWRSKTEKVYSKIENNTSDRKRVWSGELIGMVNNLGHEIIPTVYSKLSKYDKNGVCYGYRDYNYYILDKKGEIELKFKCYEILPLSDNLFAFKNYSGWGYANLNGDIIIAPTYRWVSSFSNGFAIVSNDFEGDSKFGLITKGGLEIFPPELNQIKLISQNTYFIKGYFNGIYFNDKIKFDPYSGDCISESDLCEKYYSALNK